ncbi:AraC family transcriptional regulator [Sphingobacterium corticibacterium]|uniref:AraC family transcriptional regulator n=2 Tax=Sphingobacterium corticibacterium TaxID=2484746 RepID=A0A4Q6XZ76_9SPHI|nr:AraC family transcriptional regulator [Sphingobacterium corticibacterium]
MSKALELLASGSGNGLTLYCIADKIGYSNHSYFSTLFKKHFGISPSVYGVSNHALPSEL